MLEGLSSIALKTWPYKGPVALVEKSSSSESGVQHYLIVDNWCVLDSTSDLTEYSQKPFDNYMPQIDRDIYRYLVEAIFGKKSSVAVIPLDDFSN